MSQKQIYFRKRFIRMFMTMMIPLTILSAVLFGTRYHDSMAEIREQSTISVEHVKSSLESILSNVVLQNMYLTSMTQNYLTLKRALFSAKEFTYTDVTTLKNIQALMISTVNTYDIIDSMSLYLDGGTRYLTSQYTLPIAYQTENWFELYQNMDSSMTSTFTRVQKKSEDKLIVIYRLSFARGCLIVELNVSKIEQMLSDNLYHSAQSIELITDDGQPLIHVAGRESDFVHLDSPMNGWIRSGGSSVPIYCVVSEVEESGVRIVSQVPKSVFSGELLSQISLLLLFILADTIICALLAYNVTQDSFRHIQHVLDMFNQAEQGNKIERTENSNKDEYDVIMDNIVRMFLNTAYLDLQLKEKKHEEEVSEMKALQLQINPHFLYNTLQTLDFEIKKEHNVIATHRIIQNLSDILKYALNTSGSPVTLREEIDYLRKYISIQQYRFGDQFIVYYDIEEDVFDMSVFRMMLQPLFENSIQHSRLKESQKRIYLTLEVFREGEDVRFVVSDTGEQIPEEELNRIREKIRNPVENSGVGLSNLNRRLILRYGEDYALSIESNEEGTKISFRIPEKCR